MRLAFIKKKYSPHGGAERYLQTLLTQLGKEGHELHVYAGEWTPSDHVCIHSVPVCQINSYTSTVTFARNAARSLHHEQFDRVISFERTVCQDVYRAGEGVHRAWLDIRARCEPWHKRISLSVNPLHRALLSLERELFLRTPRIIANSEMVKGQIIMHYSVPQEKISVIYNGVDLVRFNPVPDIRKAALREKLGLPENRTVALYVGSGFKRKGVPQILQGLSRLIGTRRPGIFCVFLGKDRIEHYRDDAERLGIGETVSFLGPRSDVADFYAASDFFVLPTLYDPFSNATLEALASGLPVITSKNNGVAELIENGVQGYVLDSPAGPDELAACLSEMANTWSSMRAPARQLAERYPIERSASLMLEVIKRSDFA